MSWEEMYRRDYPCRCGKSTYTEIVEMDDWNRRRDFRIMNCPECAEKERIAEEERKRKVAEKKARLDELAPEIDAYFAEHYMEKWLAYFASAKNKKAAWTLAKEVGVEHDSLSSFYQWNKGLNVEQYARKFARFYYVKKIMEAINIDDDALISKVEEAEELRDSTDLQGVY